MASIHKRPDSPYWHAAWRGENGRLFLRSTKQVERGKAMTVALEFEGAARLGRQGELTEAQCRRVLGDILARTNTGENFRAPVAAAWLREWLSNKEASKAASTVERYRGVIDGFIRHLGERAGRPLTSLTPRDVQSFVAKRQREGCSPTTVQLDAKIVRTALNLARRHGLVSVNVAEAVELPEKQSVERGTFAPAEIKLLVDTAEGEWKTLILLGYYTGARLGDCCRVTWKNVDLVKGTLGFTQAKTGKPLTIPLHPELQERLEALATADAPQEFVMPGMADLKPGGRHGLSEGFKRIVGRAGLDTERVQGGGKRWLCRRTFHALRHSFTSALANEGVAPELRMKLTGHTTEAVHRGYSHHELATLRTAINKLPSLSAATK